jgi:hypothetical protein
VAVQLASSGVADLIVENQQLHERLARHDAEKDRLFDDWRAEKTRWAGDWDTLQLKLIKLEDDAARLASDLVKAGEARTRATTRADIATNTLTSHLAKLGEVMEGMGLRVPPADTVGNLGLSGHASRADEMLRILEESEKEVENHIAAQAKKGATEAVAQALAVIHAHFPALELGVLRGEPPGESDEAFGQLVEAQVGLAREFVEGLDVGFDP